MNESDKNLTIGHPLPAESNWESVLLVEDRKINSTEYLRNGNTSLSFNGISSNLEVLSARPLIPPISELRDNKRSSASADSSSSGVGTMSGSNRQHGNISKPQEKTHSYKKTTEGSLGLRKSETQDASTELFLSSRDSTDSQLMRRKQMSNVRADSPTVGSERSNSGVMESPINTTSNASGANTAITTNNILSNNIGETNGGSRSSVVQHQSVPRSGSLARARKRARNDSRRLGRKNTSVHTALLSPGKNNGVIDMDESLAMDENDDDDDDSAGAGDEDPRGMSSRPDFSDLDSPMEDYLHAGTDLDTPYRGRQRRQTYQLPPRRRDSSLGGYGHSSLYAGPIVAGTLPRRHRLDVSLTRATTIGGADSTLRSAQRLAQSIRSGVIPPPPSEPPPATPLSGSLMSELGAMGVTGPSGLINPFALQLHNQQQQQQQQRQAAAFAAAVAASSGVHPQLLSQNAGLSNPYILGANTNASQLMQLQQQAMFLQQQQQQQANLFDAQLRQQQQQQLVASGLLQPCYASNYGTLGRTNRADSIGPMQPYLSAATLLSAQQQQQQQQRQYQTHNSTAQMNGLSGLVQSPSSALAPSEHGDAVMNKSTNAQGGSGSVVYENSYNSFHRLLSNPFPPSASQDGLHGMLTSTIGMSEALAMSLSNASPHVTAAHTNTLGRTDTLSPVTMVQSLSAPNSNPPPVPPPNHPSYDLVDARTVESPYGTHSAPTDKVLVTGTHKSKRRCPWYYWIISILVLAFLLALVLAISFSAEKRHLGDRLVERFAQDPAIIGLFDPANPAVKLEPDRPVHVILDRMGVWSAEWHMRTSRYVRYNITVSSLLSSIGIFMRRSTMPTIVRYDIFDRISGRTLQPTPRSGRHSSRTKRAISDSSTSGSPTVYRSTSSTWDVRETTRVHYLEEGIWFLAFVNDQPRPEPFTFSMGDAVMDAGCPNDCSNRGVCNRGNCDCVNGFKGPDCSIAELPKVCNGHGDYLDGACQCYPEWKGRECEILWSECTDPTCSGHGQCVTGECQCYDGFAGESCEQRTCVSANCADHGVCMDGTCRCFSGWSGSACDIPVPVMHTANFAALHREPVTSRSVDTTTTGRSTEFTRPMTSLLLLDAQNPAVCNLNCGAHAQCVLNKAEQPTCQCDPGWSGLLCDRKLCDPRCFQHGHCANGTCVCQAGWNGKHCTLNGCPAQCNGVGRCLANSDGLYSCHCPPERKGSACQAKVELVCDDQEDNDGDGLTDCLDPDCCASAHCRKLAQSDSHRGARQNRSHISAAEHAKQGCAHSEPAQYHLLITPMAQADSTFYGQLEFLLRREQIVMRNFDPRRVSVIRGTVRQSDGTAFWGCRVFDRLKAQTGYTLTDEQGRFDLPVDGGSIVQLEFLRFPTERFSAIYPVYVPVNEIVTLGDFYLYDANRTAGAYGGGLLASSPVQHDLWATGTFQDSTNAVANFGTATSTEQQDAAACSRHDLTLLGGLPVWADRISNNAPVCVDDDRTICVQNGILTYAIPIQDSRLRLVYRSDRTMGYRPVLIAQLLDQVIPDGLREIHLVVDVAGLRQTKRLEPEPGLTELFYWNRTDGYNRTVYGLVNAKVSAGYVYEGCSRVLWEHRILPLLGHELTESGLANWKVDLVHLYAVNHGIVYRGDGSHLFLKLTDWHVTPILGSKTMRRKPNQCDHCTANESGFGSPVLRLPSLVTDSLGHVVVGDGSRLRWLQSPEPAQAESVTFRASESLDSRAQRAFQSNDRRVWFSIYQFLLDFLSSGFDEQMEPTDYYLSAHPSYLAFERRFGASDPGVLDSGLFLSHTATKSIWWLSDGHEPIAQPLITPDCSEHPSSPLSVADLCTKHPLVSPRGLAVSPNDLYFADGSLILSMPLKGSPGTARPISVLVGQPGVPWQPAPCDRALPGAQMLLQNPTNLAYSAIEDAVYFVDNKQVFRLHLASQMVSLAAGKPETCGPDSMEWNVMSPPPLATDMPFSTIRGLAISPEGDLYVAEPHRVWLRRADGHLHALVGTSSTGKASEADASPHAAESLGLSDFGLAHEMRFTNITSIAVSIYGELFVADSDHALVYRVHYQLPRPMASTSTYRVASPGTDETYTFNQNGQLLQTENAITQMTLHLVDYRANAIYGWVSDIRGNNVNLRFSVHRDTQGRLLYVQSPIGLQYNVTLHPGSQQRIRELTDPIRGTRWQFTYSPTGLLLQVRRPQDTSPIQFRYTAESGRLARVLFPDGISLDTRLSDIISLHETDKVSARQPDRSIQFSYPGGRGTFECQYGESIDPWSVQFMQYYPTMQFQAVSSPARLSRRIQLPDRVGQPKLINSVLWVFDRNAQSSGSSRIVRRAGNQAAQGQPSSRTQLTRALKVRSPNDHELLSAHYPLLARSPRSAFSYLSSALALSGYRPTSGEAADWQYQKTLVVNGYDLLHVKFDWARQLETYQRSSTGHVLLQIVYNADFQPMIFNASSLQQDVRLDLPSSPGGRRRPSVDYGDYSADLDSSGPAPLSLTYNSNGQLNALHWGSAIYRFTYDSQNRLKAADLGSAMETVSYQYMDERLPYQPSVVSVSGLGPFKLFYAHAPLSPVEHRIDFEPTTTAGPLLAPIGLTRVLTPSGLRRDFARTIGLGVHQLRYTPWPGSPAPWIYEWGQDGNASQQQQQQTSSSDAQPAAQLLRFTWPTVYRCITVFPDQNRLVYDKTQIQWESADQEDKTRFDRLDSAPYVRLTDVTSGYRWTAWRTYRGTLLTSVRVEQHIPGARKAHPNLGGLLHARHRYSYNNNFNLIGIHTQLYTQSKRPDPAEDFGSIPDKLILDEETVAKYDIVTGQLLSIRDFDIVHRASSICVTYAPKSLQLCRQLDAQGRLKQVLLYPLSSRRDPLYNLTILYRPNALAAVQQREEQRGQVPRWVTFVHGPGGRLEALDREEAGSSLRSHSVLVHNSEGRLARLRIAVSDPQLHHPQSSADTGPTSRSEELQFIYDTRGLLKRRGNWQYTFDEDGFLTERRLHKDRIVDRFAYNSKGLLIWAERKVMANAEKPTSSNNVGGGGGAAASTSDSFESLDRSPLEDDIGSRRPFRVQYVYDAQDRLVMVRDTLIVRDLMQYFYADPRYPNRITHVFNHGRLVTFRLHYDPVKGHLFAVEEFARLPDTTADASEADEKYSDAPGPKLASQPNRGSSSQKHVYFVITNHEGAPTAMFSETGKPSWTAEYSATGSRRLNLPNRNKFFGNSVLEDANIPLGYAGCTVDVHTGFLFCSPTYRAYDPSGATYTSPDWRRLVSDRLPQLYRDPSLFDTHRWGSLDQQDHSLGPAGLLARVSEAIQSPSWWLMFVGFHLDSVLPQLDACTGRLLGSRIDPLSWQLPAIPQHFSLTGRPTDRTSSHGDRCAQSELLNAKLERLTVVQPSRLTPGGAQGTGLPDFFLRPLHPADTGRVQLLPAQAMFDSGVTFELNTEQFVHVYDSSRLSLSAPAIPPNLFESGRLADLLLTGTRLMDWWTMTTDSHGYSPLFVQSFARLGYGASSLIDDLAREGIRLPAYHRPTGHNLTLITRGTVGYNELWLTRASLQWRIRFVSSWSEAWDQVALDARTRGEQLAWSHEARMAQQLDLIDPARYPEAATDRLAESSAATHFLGLNYLWTFKQAYQLAQQGHLAGYRWVPVVGESGDEPGVQFQQQKQQQHLHLPRSFTNNGTAWTRLYNNPGIYQLRAVDVQKPWRNLG